MKRTNFLFIFIAIIFSSTSTIKPKFFKRFKKSITQTLKEIAKETAKQNFPILELIENAKEKKKEEISKLEEAIKKAEKILANRDLANRENNIDSNIIDDNSENSEEIEDSENANIDSDLDQEIILSEEEEIALTVSQLLNALLREKENKKLRKKAKELIDKLKEKKDQEIL